MEGYRIQRRDFYQPYLRIVGGRPAGTSRRGRRPKADPASIEKLELSDDEARLALDALSRVASCPCSRSPRRRARRSASSRSISTRTRSRTRRSCSSSGRARRSWPRGFGSSRMRCSRASACGSATAASTAARRRSATSRRTGCCSSTATWYLVGHDALRAAGRRVPRGTHGGHRGHRSSPHTSDYDVPDDFRLDDYAGRDAWEFGAEGEDPVTAQRVVPVPGVAARGAEPVTASWWSCCRSGSAVRRFQVSQVNPFLRWLLGMEGEARAGAGGAGGRAEAHGGGYRRGAWPSPVAAGGMRPRRTNRVRGARRCLSARRRRSGSRGSCTSCRPRRARTAHWSMSWRTRSAFLAEGRALDAINEVVTRAYYHPAGPGDQLQIRSATSAWRSGRRVSSSGRCAFRHSKHLRSGSDCARSPRKRMGNGARSCLSWPHGSSRTCPPPTSRWRRSPPRMLRA